MADFSKTLSNSINLFGASPSSKWGDDWGSFLWGEGTELTTLTIKVLDGSITISESYTYTAQFLRQFNTTLSIDTYDLDLFLYDKPTDWYCLFRKPTNDGEEQVQSDYELVDFDQPSWTDVDDEVPDVGTGPTADGLQLESGDFILLESGDYILLEGA